MLRNQSYQIRGLKIPSRYFCAPINTGFAINGEPTEDCIKYHSDRAGEGIGIVYIGNVAVHRDYVNNKHNLYLTNEIGYWKR